MTYKNVVFDFGQVMVRFDPRYMTEQYVSGDDVQLVADVVFDRLYWDKLDSGDISDEDVVAACRKRLPNRLWDAVDSVYYNWIYHLPAIDGMIDVVRDLKTKGARVFLLSNISEYFAAHADEVPVLSEFEGCVFSAVVGHVKPHRDIFEYVCDKYAVSPAETVFVDDNAANIAGAENYGISGYLFDGSAEKLREFLQI